MKYKQVKIELKSPNQLKGWGYCPDCKGKLTYKNSSCYCEKEKKEFIFYVVPKLSKE